MNYLIVILGPTAIGKTDLSIEIAQNFDTCIISADSRQIYKELKIGTAIPSNEQLNAVQHYFIGNKSIHDYYNASMYECEVIDLLSKLFKDKKAVILTGGSGMYIDAVCNGIDDLPTIDADLRNELKTKFNEEGIEGLRFDLKKLDPKYYAEVDLRNPKRILKALEVCIMTGKPYSYYRTNTKKKRDFEIIKIGLNREREELYHIINIRVDKMIEDGLVDEAKKFYKFKNYNSLNTVGYKELFGYFDNEYSLYKAIELIKRDSRRYAKRQLSWFNRDKTINWFHRNEKNEIFKFINQKLGIIFD